MAQTLYTQHGSINTSLVVIIVLTLLTVGATSFGVWSYLSYTEQKTNVDGKVGMAVATAKKDQADIDEAKFAEREKEPNRQYAGPDDYGRLTFQYPKTWSVYEATDVSRSSGDTFRAYFSPIAVPPISETQQYALRVTIEQRAYETVVKSYQSKVQEGELSSSSIDTGGHTGTRLDGKFNDDIRGSAVIFKIRDKTAILRTDADIFKPDFEKIIKTIDYNS